MAVRELKRGGGAGGADIPPPHEYTEKTLGNSFYKQGSSDYKLRHETVTDKREERNHFLSTCLSVTNAVINELLTIDFALNRLRYLRICANRKKNKSHGFFSQRFFAKQ